MKISRVMKGEMIEVADYGKIKFPVLGSPKIDGFRCYLNDIARTSRMGRFPNKAVHKELKGLLHEASGIDGEIVVGKRRGEGVLSRTSSGVTSEGGHPDWRLWIFDAPRENLGFELRTKLAQTIVKSLNNPRIRYVKHVWLENVEELQAYADWALSQGFEGIMIRDPLGPYKQGKSTVNQGWLLKIKPFETSEARITGYYEEMENTNEQTRDATGKAKRSSAKSGKVAKGCLGGFIGTDVKSGEQVRCGGGFSKAQRKAFWQIKDELVEARAIFTYKAQPREGRTAPQHPNFIALRPDWDMG